MNKINTLLQNPQKAYLPFGVQTDVSLSTIEEGGWEVCFTNTYDKIMTDPLIESIANDTCTKKKIMVSCRRTDTPDTLTMLAWAPRDYVFKKGSSAGDNDISHGTRWFWTGTFFGFSIAGSPSDSCYSDQDKESRLCWKRSGNYGGWSCGANRVLNSKGWERVFLHQNMFKEVNIYRRVSC